MKMAGERLVQHCAIRGQNPVRSAGIDYFRMLAAFMVIAIHIGPFADWSKEADFLLTYCLGRVAVPFFFMTTGYFVLAPYVRSGFRTRNGIFFAPIFLLLGMWIAFARRICPVENCIWGTAVSALLMMGEGFLTYSLGWQRHNSMYIFLVPLMFFLFQLLLWIPGKAPVFCRNGSLILYVIHPAMIVALRGAAKAAGLTKLLVDCVFVQYIVVCMLSLAAAGVYVRVKGNS